MDFQLVPIAAGAPGAPAALAARGPDPLISIPANSVLRRINGLTLIIPPGAMVAVGSCLHASIVGAGAAVAKPIDEALRLCAACHSRCGPTAVLQSKRRRLLDYGFGTAILLQKNFF